MGQAWPQVLHTADAQGAALSIKDLLHQSPVANNQLVECNTMLRSVNALLIAQSKHRHGFSRDPCQEYDNNRVTKHAVQEACGRMELDCLTLNETYFTHSTV